METERASKAILRWAETGETYAPPAWQDLPSIPLYMDQVILYLGESLQLFQRGENNSLLTSSMINNYVKHGLLPHPDKKKYRKEHLGSLMAICMLKQVLAIQDVKTLFSPDVINEDEYDFFREANQACVRNTCQAVAEACRTGEDLKRAALLLAIEANARRAAAERILWELGRKEPDKEEKGKQ